MERRRKRNNRLLDTLTGVYSRDSLDARLHEEIARGLRHSSPFSLVLIDLDHFKSVNDSLGHLRGDAVLVEAAARFKTATRRGDLVFRFGGDEFLLVLHNTNKASAAILARRIQDATRNELFPGDPPLKLTYSVGVADFPSDGQTAEAVLAAA